MQFAESIRYGGQLIDAEDCDYESYRRLGLLCPECKAPVFLRADHERLLKGQSVKVKSTFAHFKAVDPQQIARCENRVSTYSKLDINKKAISARNQRLKKLQRWFWEIFTSSNNELQYVAEMISTEEMFKYFLEQDPLGIIREAREIFTSQDADSFGKAISGCIEKSCTEYESKKHLIGENTRKCIKYLIDSDRGFHTLICIEVFLFLRSKSNLYLLNKTIACSYLVLQLSDTAKNSGLDEEPVLMTLSNLTQLVVMIAWFDKFERLEKGLI